MGFSAAVALGAAVAGPKVLEATGITKKPEMPNLAVEKPGAPVDTNPNSNADSQKAAEQQRKRAAAGGRGDTIKTGTAGLGEIKDQNLAPKTLLGY